MKKYSFIFFSFLIFLCPVFGQSIDKAQYKSIDPFDYKLEAENARNGSIRKYVSLVQFWTQIGIYLSFYSLDEGTLLTLKVTKRFNPMQFKQKVAIYFTATKNYTDELILDDIDPSITTEEGIGLVKSLPDSSRTINRSQYTEIDPFDYKLEAENAENGSTRKYKSIVLFWTQIGTFYFFNSLDEGTMLTLNVTERLNPMRFKQKVTIYFTTTKNYADELFLDDIEY